MIKKELKGTSTASPNTKKGKLDHLDPDNCNKAMCKTCIFRTDGNQFILSADRWAEIQIYLATFQSSHICHTTKLTCYGAMSYQAEIMYRMGIIPDNSVQSFLETAERYLTLKQKS